MTLGKKQRIFAVNLARLILWADKRGYEVTFGEVQRPEMVAKIYEQQGKGIKNSLHRYRLAADLNLFINGRYQTRSDAHEPLGAYWKTLHPMNRWGGDFTKPDGNHYSMTHWGLA